MAIKINTTTPGRTAALGANDDPYVAAVIPLRATFEACRARKAKLITPQIRVSRIAVLVL
jgi:hypothetical protein